MGNSQRAHTMGKLTFHLLVVCIGLACTATGAPHTGSLQVRAERPGGTCGLARECHTWQLQYSPRSCAVAQPARDARRRAGATRPTAVIYEGDARGFGVRQGVNDSMDPLVRRLAVGCLFPRPLGACASVRPDGPVPLSARPTLPCLRDR